MNSECVRSYDGSSDQRVRRQFEIGEHTVAAQGPPGWSAMAMALRRLSEARLHDAAAAEQLRRERLPEDDYDEDEDLQAVAELDLEDDEDGEDDGDSNLRDVQSNEPGSTRNSRRSSLARGVRTSLGKATSAIVAKGSQLRNSLRRSSQPRPQQWARLGPSPLRAGEGHGNAFLWKVGAAKLTHAEPWNELISRVNEPIVSVSSRGEHLACVTQSGRAFWGTGGNEFLQINADIVQVACGAEHVGLLAANGCVSVICGADTAAKQVSVPGGEPIVQIVSTFEILVALGISGRVFISHKKSMTKLRHAGTSIRFIPMQTLAAGAHHWVAISASGRVYGCGANYDGQLGFDNVESCPEPVRLPVPFAVDAVACGDAHTIYLGRPSAVMWHGEGRPASGDVASFFEKSGIELNHVCAGAHGMNSFLATNGEIFNWIANEPEPNLITLSDLSQSAYALIAIEDQVVALAAPSDIAVIEREVRLALNNRIYESAWVTAGQLYNVASHALETGDITDTLILMRTIFKDPYMASASLCRPAYSPTAHASKLSWSLKPSRAIARADKALGSGLDVEGVLRSMLAVTKAIVNKENSIGDIDAARRLLQSIMRPITGALVKGASIAMEPDQVRPYLLLFISPTALLTQFEHERLVIGTEKLPQNSLQKFLHTWIFLEVPGDALAQYVVPRIVDSISVYLSRRKVAAPNLKQLCLIARRIYLMNNTRKEEDAKRRRQMRGTNTLSKKAIVASPTIVQDPISNELFYTRALLSYTEEFLRAYFFQWRENRIKRRATGQMWTIFQYSFLLSPDTKTTLLKIEDQEMQVRPYVGEGDMPFLFAMDGRIPPFILEISRANLLQDTMRALGKASARDLKRPLMIRFKNEEGVDIGGVKKEFFQLLSAELFSEDYGMFRPELDTGEFWFNTGPLSTAVRDPDSFFMVGQLLGLAVYNNTIIDMNFCPAFYRLLLGQWHSKPDLRDLAELNPVLANGLQQMLEYDGPDFEDVFVETFEAPEHRTMSGKPEPLVPGGDKKWVNHDNVHEYVSCYVRYLLGDSIKAASEPLLRGFHMLIPVDLTSFNLFARPDELELALTGSDEFELDRIRDNTTYEGYTSRSPVVQWLWVVLGEMNHSQQREFLRFCTGAPKLQVGIFQLKIQRAGPDTDQLPTAATCFNILLLPEYASLDKVRSKLLVAINNAEGFGLQ